MADISDTLKGKTDQLNADDLKEMGPRDLLITRAVVKSDDEDGQKVWLYYQGDGGKPYKPGLSMRRVIGALWGKESDVYVGRTLRVFCNPDIIFGKLKVGGIRISHMSHIKGEKTAVIPSTRGKKVAFTVSELRDAPSGNVATSQRTRIDLTPEQKAEAAKKKCDTIIAELNTAPTIEAIDALLQREAEIVERFKANYPDLDERLLEARVLRLEDLSNPIR